MNIQPMPIAMRCGDCKGSGDVCAGFEDFDTGDAVLHSLVPAYSDCPACDGEGYLERKLSNA